MTRDEFARKTAAAHRDIDLDITKVERLVAEDEDLPGEPVKLLFTNLACGDYPPIAVAFGSTDGGFPLVLCEVSVRTRALLDGRLMHWTIGDELS